MMMQPQQGPMMGGPAVPFDEAGFRAKLAAEKEAKQRQREQNAKEVYRKIEEKRNVKGASSFIWWLMASDAFAIMLMGFAMVGQSWADQSFIGTGIKVMHIKTGLFDINIEVLCGKNWLEDKICKLGAKYNGQHDLADFLGTVCSLPFSQSCTDMERMQYASMMIMFGTLVNVIFLLVSHTCAYFYWNEEQNPRWRSRAMVFGCFGPIIGCLVVGFWLVVMPDMQQLPRTWSGPLAGSSLFGYKPVSGFAGGTCYYLAVTSNIIIAVGHMMFPCYVIHHPKEEDAEDYHEERMEVLQERLETAKYGGGDPLNSMLGSNNMSPGGQGMPSNGMGMPLLQQQQPRLVAGMAMAPPPMMGGGGPDFGMGPGNHMYGGMR